MLKIKGKGYIYCRKLQATSDKRLFWKELRSTILHDYLTTIIISEGVCVSVCLKPFFLPIRINLDQTQYGIRTFRGVIGGVWVEGGRSGGSLEVKVDIQGGHMM